MPTSLLWVLLSSGMEQKRRKLLKNTAHSLIPGKEGDNFIPGSCPPPQPPLLKSMIMSQSGLSWRPLSECALPNSGAAYGKGPLGWLSTRPLSFYDWGENIKQQVSHCLGLLPLHGRQCEDAVVSPLWQMSQDSPSAGYWILAFLGSSISGL